jgi:hypothetical protein
MVSKIAMFLEILSDGKWHEVEELQWRLKLDGCEAEEITGFLNNYGLAKIDVEKRKVKVHREFRKFLTLTVT